ncbi:hypothetical protein BC828DRAFT_272062 [Blastocladiella britannica]|nr:hypothetical protein BC828DRAFT_272062 [Blastocladiella britannica]
MVLYCFLLNFIFCSLPFFPTLLPMDMIFLIFNFWSEVVRLTAGISFKTILIIIMATTDDMEVDGDEQLLQQLYLQHHLRRPFMSQGEAIGCYEKCCTAARRAYIRPTNPKKKNTNTYHLDPFNEADFTGFLTQVNVRISQLDLFLRQEEHPNRNTTFVILSNGNADDIAKLATTYKPAEIAVFRDVLEKIALAESGQVTSMDLLNCVPSTVATKTAFEATTLQRWLDEGWIEATARGVYTIGLRSLKELDRYIRAQFTELSKCGVCESVAVTSVPCTGCDMVYHRRCLEQMSRGSGPRKCTGCRAPIIVPNAPYAGIEGTSGGGSKRREAPSDSQRRAEAEDEEEEDGASDGDDDGEAQPRRKIVRSSSLRVNAELLG